MTHNQRAAQAGRATPGCDEAPAVGAAQGFKSKKNGQADCHPIAQSGEALRVIDGEDKARAYLASLQATQADSAELAFIVSMLYGATRRGFCRVVEKAIGGRP